MHKRTEITIETERLLVVSQRRERTVLWCHRCAGSVPTLTLEVTARIACTTPQVILGLAEAGRLHSVVTPEGRLFICSNSLALEKPDESSLGESTSTKHFDCK